jgi:hypothetical protein
VSGAGFSDLSIARVKPSEIILENEGAIYEPSETAGLSESYGDTRGWVQAPVVYRGSDGRYHTIDGAHRLLSLKLRGWGETPIPVVVVRLPPAVEQDKTGKALLKWRLVARAHANSRRRRVRPSEWKTIFESGRDDLGLSQEQIAAEFGFARSEVSRILSGSYERHVEQVNERQKEARRKVSDDDEPIVAGSTPVLAMAGQAALEAEEGVISTMPVEAAGPALPQATTPKGEGDLRPATVVETSTIPDSQVERTQNPADVFNRALSERLSSAEKRVPGARTHLYMAAYAILGKLKALGIRLPDPASEPDPPGEEFENGPESPVEVRKPE